MPRTAPLAIMIATGDGRSINQQIVDAVRMEIVRGALSAGSRLPSVRGLARQLGINPNTVAKASGQLTAEGWLDAQQGLGLFVAHRRQRLSAEERERRLDEAVDRFVNEVAAIQCEPDVALDRLAGALDALAPRKIA